MHRGIHKLIHQWVARHNVWAIIAFCVLMIYAPRMLQIAWPFIGQLTCAAIAACTVAAIVARFTR